MRNCCGTAWNNGGKCVGPDAGIDLADAGKISEAYMGTNESAGAFSKVMKKTADFLLEQGSITESPSQEEFDYFHQSEVHRNVTWKKIRMF